MGWKDRVATHDEIAMPIATKILEAQGYECHKMGIETGAQALYKALATQDDQVSRMMRFKPDIIAIGDDSMLCEVKSEPGDHRNFSIEVDSYGAASMWNLAVPQRVIYFFVDLARDNNGKWRANSKRFRLVNVSICWASDIPNPTRISVPRRWDFQENYERMQGEWSNTEIIPVEYKGGSGTPYFLISKKADYLMGCNLPDS